MGFFFMKKSFILHLDSLNILSEMTNEQAGILIKAIYNYHKGEELELDFGMKMAFAPFKNQFIRDDSKYSEFVDKQKLNGSKGGRPPKSVDNQDVTINPTKPKETQETQAFFEKPKEPYNDSVSDNVNDNVSKNVSKKKVVFDFETNNINLLKEWGNFIEMRKSKRKALKQVDFDTLKTKLEEYSGGDENLKIQIIEYSRVGGYPNFYPLKNNQRQNTITQPEPTAYGIPLSNWQEGYDKVKGISISSELKNRNNEANR
jgi:hypothetical protein